MTTKRAAIYCRVSTTLQATDEKTSLQHQERQCRERALEDGYTVAEEYVVHDASSGSLDSVDRKALQRLLGAAERGAFDVVVMDLIDRTSRGGVFEFVDICQRFLRFEVTPLWATDRSIDLTESAGQLIAAAKAWGANQEKESIMRRFRRGRQDRIAAGHLDKATISYGYRWADEARTTWEPDPATAPIVQRIFHAIVSGVSATKLAILLTAEGIPTPGEVKGRKREHKRFKGKPPRWILPTVASIIRNPAYKGERAHNRYVATKRPYRDHRERNLASRNSISQRDRADWTIIPVPPLVTREVWDEAQVALSRQDVHPTKMPKRYTAAEVLLYGGYVRCAHCGYALSPTLRQPDPRQQRTKRVWYYHCGHRHPTKTGEPCKGVTIVCSLLDPVVWAEAVRLIRDPDYFQQLLKRGDEVWAPETQVAHYTELLAKLDQEDADIARELVRLAGNPKMGHIRANIEQQAERNAELRDGYQERLAAALAEFESRQAQHARVRTFAEWAAAQAPTVDTLSAEDQREILIHSLHPTIFIANTKSDEPRVAILFAVSAEAAAHIDPYELYTTSQWQNAKGEYYTSFVEEMPTGGAEDDDDASAEEFDFNGIFSLHLN